MHRTNSLPAWHSTVAASAVLILGVGPDDLSHESMANDVALVQVAERDSLDAWQQTFDLDQTRILPRRKVDLRLVACDDGFAVHPEPGEKHLHLRAGGVLGFVQNDECISQRAPAHVR